jgi:putative sigma-54 modulation protein
MKNESLSLNITARHMELTEAMREFIRGRLQSIELEFPRVIRARVILEVQKYRKRCEVILSCNGHRHFEAKAEAEDMYASIHSAFDKANHQIQKYKARLHRGRHHIPGRRLPWWNKEARPIALLARA